MGVLCLCLVVGLSWVCASAAVAQGGLKLCVPAKEGKPLVTPKAGACRTGYALTELGAEGKEGKPGKEGPRGPEGPKGGLTNLTGEVKQALKGLLSHMVVIPSGIGGKPTIRFTGVNVQIVSGTGSTQEVNGAGNLVLGYDESSGAQTGSHNLIMGSADEYSAFGSLIFSNNIRALAPFTGALGAARGPATYTKESEFCVG